MTLSTINEHSAWRDLPRRNYFFLVTYPSNKLSVNRRSMLVANVNGARSRMRTHYSMCTLLMRNNYNLGDAGVWRLTAGRWKGDGSLSQAQLQYRESALVRRVELFMYVK